MYPSAPMYDGNPERYADENQVYASMLQWDEFQVPEEHTGAEQMQHMSADTAKHEPTAPPWEGSATAMETATATETMQQTQPIQCIITPPSHTTPTAVTALALVGSVSVMAVLVLMITLCWLALQGVHVTGFWLTLTPSKWDPTNEDRALP